MYKSRYHRSLAMLEAARQSLTGGASSPFRSKLPVPLFFEEAWGPRLRDVDGNEYIDYLLAWGPLILGHRHPRLLEAMSEAARRPHIYGAQHAMERKVAERLQELIPCAERVAFTSSGSEAVQCALRLARAFTGRERILKFEGHYHGWMDSALISYRGSLQDSGPADAPVAVAGSGGQVRNALENVCIAQWNDRECVERLFAGQGDKIAAVICEPVVCNSGSVEPESGFLAMLREISRKHGALLIFDEIITGLRMAKGSAQATYGVTPDLATLGKAVGGGLPLSVIAGRADVMEQMATGAVVFGGTFNGNPISLAAAAATLEELFRDNGEPLRHANTMGEQLRTLLERSAATHSVPFLTTGFGAAFSMHFGLSAPPRTYREYLANRRDLLLHFVRTALDEGLYLLPDGRLYVSAVHTSREVEETAMAAERVFAGMTAKLEQPAQAGS